MGHLTLFCVCNGSGRKNDKLFSERVFSFLLLHHTQRAQTGDLRIQNLKWRKRTQDADAALSSDECTRIMPPLGLALTPGNSMGLPITDGTVYGPSKNCDLCGLKLTSDVDGHFASVLLESNTFIVQCMQTLAFKSLPLDAPYSCNGSAVLEDEPPCINFNVLEHGNHLRCKPHMPH